MPTIQMRNVPLELYELLSKLAKDERRSISQQAIVLLEQALGDLDIKKTRRMALLEKISKRETLKVKTSPADLLRQDRDR
jgi:hypothetical protein